MNQQSIFEQSKNLDRNLVTSELFWRSATKMQGFNTGVTSFELLPDQRKKIFEITKQVDCLNISILEENERSVPSIRLNRLDFLIDESGETYLLEQNPGWVDNLAFMSFLSEDFRLLYELCQLLRLEDFKQIILTYSEAAAYGRYEIERLKQVLMYEDFLGSRADLLVLPLNEIRPEYIKCKSGILMSAPVSKLNNNEKDILDGLYKNSNVVCFPDPNLTLLDNKSLLIGSELCIPDTVMCPDNLDELFGMVREGFKFLKPLVSASNAGIVVLDAQTDYEKILELIQEGGYVLQKAIDPIKVEEGIGWDYMRAKGKPMKPDEVSLSGRAVKLNVWSLNGESATILGCAARKSDTVLVSDSGFNFKI